MNLESTGLPEGKYKAKRVILRRSLIVGAIITGLALLLLIIGLIFEQKARGIICTEVQSMLKPGYTLNADRIALKVFKNFPDLAIEFENLCLSYKTTSDTIVFAQNALLGFSIFDLWADTITIRELFINDARAHLDTYKNGMLVYDCFKTETASQTSSQTALKKVVFKRLNIFWNNRKTMQKGHVVLDQFKGKGQFNAEDAELEIDTKGNLQDLQSANLHLAQKPFEIKTKLKKQKTQYTIMYSTFNCAGVEFKVSGGLNYDRALRDANFDATLKSNAVSELFSWLPKSSAEIVKTYKAEGVLELEIQLKKDKAWQVQAAFNLKNARFENPKYNIIANQVNAKGNLYWTPRVFKINLDHVYARVHSDSLSLQGTYSKSTSEVLDVNLFANMQLQQWMTLIPVDTLSMLKGQIKTQMALHASRLNDMQPWQTHASAAKFSYREGELKFKHDSLAWKGLNIEAQWNGETLKINQFKGARGSSDIFCKAIFPNALNTIWRPTFTPQFEIEGHSNNLCVSDFFSQTNDTSSFFPIQFKGTCNWTCDALIYKKNTAQHVDVYFNISPEHIMGSFSAKLWNGNMNADFKMLQGPQTIQNVLQTRYSGINLEQALRENDNMGQTWITHQQVSGQITGTTSAKWHTKFNGSVLDTGVIVFSSTHIKSGIISNYEPLMALSKYININELKRIVFSDFNLDLNITHNTIFLNKTELRNNALNMDLWGKQTFSDSISYHIRLSLTELLFKKIKNPLIHFVTREKSKAFGTALLITGTIDHPVVGWDKERDVTIPEADQSSIKSQNKIIKLLHQVKDSLKPIRTKTTPEPLEFEAPKRKPKQKNTIHERHDEAPSDNADDF